MSNVSWNGKPRAASRKRLRKTVSLPYGRKRRKPSTEEDNMKIEWILCPFCGSKTRLKIRDDTVLENFPLYCPKCKHETLITVRKLNLSIVQEPDAEPIIRKVNSLVVIGPFLFQYTTRACPAQWGKKKTVAGQVDFVRLLYILWRRF